MNSTELKQARKNRGWSQERLATELNVSVHTVRAWEQDKNPVPRWVEKDVFSEAELNIPLELIGQVNDVASKEKLTFEQALAKVLKHGLRAIDGAADATSA